MGTWDFIWEQVKILKSEALKIGIWLIQYLLDILFTSIWSNSKSLNITNSESHRGVVPIIWSILLGINQKLILMGTMGMKLKTAQ